MWTCTTLRARPPAAGRGRGGEIIQGVRRTRGVQGVCAGRSEAEWHGTSWRGKCGKVQSAGYTTVRWHTASECAHCAATMELERASQPVLRTSCIGACCDFSSATDMRFVTVLVQMSFLNAIVKHGVPRPGCDGGPKDRLAVDISRWQRSAAAAREPYISDIVCGPLKAG
eukprot:scaffold14778_cov109-Isochrysis_galbana.AAC.6